jgi:hypothetical protein
MSADNNAPQARPGTDRRMKIVFVVVLLIAAACVYYLQRRPPGDLTKDWPEGLGTALARAKDENRQVLVFFVGKSLSDTARRLLDTTLRQPANKKAIAEGRFMRVHMALDSSLRSDAATKYKIKELPTMVLLGPDGAERNRREGFIGEVPFRSDFLSCKVIQKPES